jgi:hypothetical protein
MKQPNTDMGTRHESGEMAPKGAKSSDGTGERTAKIVNGVAMGRKDSLSGMKTPK